MVIKYKGYRVLVSQNPVSFFYLLMMMAKAHIFLLIFLFSVVAINAQQTRKISVHMKSQSLKNGTKFEQEANCYFDNSTGTFVTHYFEPNEFVKITNRKGEMKIYFPEKNEVSIKQNFYFSSENELLHYFVNNLIDDLGLKREGFSLTDTQTEDGLTITTWRGPENLAIIGKIEIVYDGFKPIYVGYVNPKGNIVKKTFYSDYYEGNDFILPLKITEISYPEEQDSTIRRTIYSDVMINNEVSDAFLNFSIPNDATIIE